MFAFVRTSWHLSSLAYSVIDRLKSIIFTVFKRCTSITTYTRSFEFSRLSHYLVIKVLIAYLLFAIQLCYSITSSGSCQHLFLIIFNLIWKKERRKRDSNPRAACATYTLSRGASSASWVFLQKPNNAIITIKFYTLAKRMHI